jgi:hypothetical protein
MHLNRPRQRLVTPSLCVVILLLALPGHAGAHVKWFCGVIDLRETPKALSAVLSSLFLSRGLTFLLLVVAGSAVDAAISRRWPRLEQGDARLEAVEHVVIRVSLAAYMVGLSAKLAVVPWGPPGDGAILTPDLFVGNHLISLVQILIALMLVLRRTCPAAGLGLAGLYAFGILRYGLFHMTDYVFFLGIAGYLILVAPHYDRRPAIRNARVPLLAGTLAFSLMWTAIEKFLYPGWTEIVLAIHPSVAMGFPAPFVTVTAGFVEFTLAFYLLVGHSLLRPGALLFMMIFIVAIPEFGVLDGIGHLPIIGIFLVVILHGVSRLQSLTRPQAASPLRSATWVGSLYVGILVSEMAMYYALQKTTWW